MAIDDTKRLLALTMPQLGAGVLSPVAFHAEERISAPYEVTIEAVSQQPAIDPNQLLFTPACLRVGNSGGTRYFHGVVRAISRGGQPLRGLYRYTLSLVPRLWFKGQTTDCRIFQSVTLEDIIRMLCAEVQQTVSPAISDAITPYDYLTQYNETDLQFLARIIEEAGVFYFFEHTEGDHTLVVTDQQSAFPAAPKPALSVVYEGDTPDTLQEWRVRTQTVHGSVRWLDYDPAAPRQPVVGSSSTTLTAGGAAERDVAIWPARTTKGAVAQTNSAFAMQAAEAEAQLTDSSGTNPLLVAGGRFQLVRDPQTDAANVDYVVQAIAHHGRDETWAGVGGEMSYGNSFTAFPASVTWRQRLVQRRPAMPGIVAAVVIGDSPIDSEAMFRVRVRVMWDYREQTSSISEVWVRILQPWAGNGWGWQNVPRIGTEVGVAFMDGDADRPVVVGAFYNGQMAPPFALPGDQNKSGLRTRSVPDGGTSNYSELSFDDTMGAEKVLLHAERDMTREVEHDDTIQIGNKQTITVTAGRQATVQAGGDQLTVQAGDLTINVESGSVSVEAQISITLKVGENSVTIDQSGITVAGTMIKLQGQAMVQTKGPMVQVNAEALLQLQGGIVMVN